jgi:hypothetical protein
MSMPSWVGSVWSLRGVEGAIIGQVRAVEGDFVTLAIVGLGGEPPEGLEVLPYRGGYGRLARVSSECLLGNWKRMGNEPGGAMSPGPGSAGELEAKGARTAPGAPLRARGGR